MKPEFVHLHLHTDYSMLDGACDVEKLVSTVKKHNMPMAPSGSLHMPSTSLGGNGFG